MKKIMILIAASVAAVSSNAQSNFRQKAITNANNAIGVNFLLPPKLKIANQGFIFPKKTYEFVANSRFRYRTIIIQDLDNNHEDFDKSAKLIAAAIGHRGQQIWPADIITDSGYKGAFKIGWKANELYIELDMDAILKPNFSDEDLYSAFFNALTQSLFVKIAVLEQSHDWPCGITQNIVEKIFDNLPVLPYLALNRYLMISDPTYSFLLLNPKITLQVDNVIKERPDIQYKIGKETIPGDENFWSFNLIGTTLVKFYRDKAGNLMQAPFLSSDGPTTTNLLNNTKPKSVLEASTADIQLSSDLTVARYISLFQSGLKPNNQQALSAERDINVFAAANSELYFYDVLDDNFLQFISANANLSSGHNLNISTFSQRSLITPMFQVFLQKSPVLIKTASTIGILKQQGILPDLKKLCIERVFNGKYRKVENAEDDLILLPDDRINF